MAKYGPLRELLASIAAEKAEVTLSFADIERTIVASLPPMARDNRAWWSNTLARSHAHSWLNTGWLVRHLDMDQELVRFERSGEGVSPKASTRSARSLAPDRPRRERTGSYGGLREFLRRVPAEQTQLALAFSELESILGHPLPPFALRHPAWWANTRGHATQGNLWLSLGWKVEKVYLKAKIVVFHRAESNPLRAVPRHVNDILEEKGAIHQVHTATLRDWIRFCRRVGWYFQGIVLYDRGGLVMETLSESDQAGVEEDYRACKQALLLYKDALAATS